MYTGEQIKSLQLFLTSQFGVLADALDKPSNLLSIQDILTRYKLADMSELLSALSQHSQRSLRDAVLSLACAHETSWFRDQYPFELIKQRILPDWYARHHAPSGMRIWSAACSKGQEPYSIAMTILSYFAANASHPSGQFSILATDVSASLIDYARKGRYSALEVSRGLSAQQLNAHFKAHEASYLLKSNVKQSVEFTVHNLLDEYRALGQFDMIFCRNVLLYFSKPIQATILKQLHQSLRPGGYLFLGASEMMPMPSQCFEMVYYPTGIVYRAKPH